MQQPAHLALVGRAFSIGGRRIAVSKYLGEGGFSFVYLAADEVSGEQLVLKRMLAQTPEMQTLVKNEIQMMERLKHPKVVQYLGHESNRSASGTEHFVLMEFCAGSWLCASSCDANLCNTGGHLLDIMKGMGSQRFSESQILRILQDLCAALSYLHHMEPPVAHRDIKLENLLRSSHQVVRAPEITASNTRSDCRVTSSAISGHA